MLLGERLLGNKGLFLRFRRVGLEFVLVGEGVLLVHSVKVLHRLKLVFHAMILLIRKLALDFTVA